MSDTAGKPGPAVPSEIAEVQAILPSVAALDEAIGQLTQAGFDRADLSLPNASVNPANATPEQGADVPTTDTDRRQARTLGTSMAGTIGAFAAAGATVATGGAAAVAIAAAAAGGLGAGALAGAANNAAVGADHAGKAEAAERGELVLSVRAATPERQERAEAILRGAGAQTVERLIRSTADIRSGVDSASWTGD